MKLFQIFLSLICLVLLTQCNNAEPELSTTLCEGDPTVTLTVTAVDEISLEFPECFSTMPLQGIDSYVGKIEAADQGVEITYDIGLLAGSYVQEDTPNQISVQGVNEEFRYVISNNTLTITFPGAGPANFSTNQIEHQDDLIEFFKTLKVN